MSQHNVIQSIQQNEYILTGVGSDLATFKEYLDQHTKIHHLRLRIPVGSGNELQAISLLADTKITHLSISIEYLDSIETICFAEIMAGVLCKNSSLTLLSLRNCGLGDENINKIMLSIFANKYSSLVAIDLAENYLSNEGAENIINLMTSNQQLKYLCLESNCPIGVGKYSTLQDLLKRNQLLSDCLQATSYCLNSVAM